MTDFVQCFSVSFWLEQSLFAASFRLDRNHKVVEFRQKFKKMAAFGFLLHFSFLDSRQAGMTHKGGFLSSGNDK